MKVKVGIIQATPVFFDLKKTVKKVKQLIIKNAKKGCQLLVLPESFIPGYPRGFSFGANVGKRTEEGRALYAQYWKNSLAINSKEFFQIEKTVKENGVYLVIGVTERDEQNKSLYCSMFYFSPTKGFLGSHRKIKPTGTERVIWGEADGKGLLSFDTPIGKLGGLICWENYMPLARMSMYQKGVEIYIAPTADSRTSWTATMQHIAGEGRCFVLGCNQYFSKKDYPKAFQKLVKNEKEDLCRGGSIIVSPMGEILAGPLWDKEGTLIAELDLDEIVKSKMDFDVVGHYSRDDIFQLNIVGQPDIQKG